MLNYQQMFPIAQVDHARATRGIRS